MKLVKEAIVIVITIGFVFAIANTQLADYIAQILGFIILVAVIYIVVKQRKLKKSGSQEELFRGSYLEFFAITSVILLMVFITNGFHSSLFFLAYFLLFGITFIFEPIMIIVFMIGLIVLFLPQALEGDVFANMIRLGALALLSPIAFFFGNEFKKREKLEAEIDRKTNKIISDVDKLVEDKENSISETQMETVDDISNQAKELREKILKD